MIRGEQGNARLRTDDKFEAVIGSGREFSLREGLLIPGVEVLSECPMCRAMVRRDLGSVVGKLPYTVFNKHMSITMIHTDCPKVLHKPGHFTWEVKLRVNLTVELA